MSKNGLNKIDYQTKPSVRKRKIKYSICRAFVVNNRIQNKSEDHVSDFDKESDIYSIISDRYLFNIIKHYKNRPVWNPQGILPVTRLQFTWRRLWNVPLAAE